MRQISSGVPIIFRVLMPLIAGVVCSFYTGFEPKGIFVQIVLVGLIVIFLLGKWFLRRSGILITLFLTTYFFLFGAFLNGYTTSVNHANYFNQKLISENNLVQIKLVESPEEKVNSVKCYVQVLKVDNQQVVGKSLVYFEKTDEALNLAYGDELLIRASFQEIHANGNPKEFDYARYLRIHDVGSQAYVPAENWVYIGNSGSVFMNRIFGIRDWLDDLLTHSGMSDNNLMVAKALILGKKESLDRETLRTYSSAGAMHVLAVSGLHVGIVMLLLNFLFSPIKRLRSGRYLFLVLVVTGIWFYALITGLSSSVMRAAVMFSFVTIGLEIERETSVYQSIMVSAFLMILIEPLVIFQVGFQLSYLAVLGIVYVQPKIYNLWYIRSKFLDKIWQISSVSIAAQFATFPLGLFYFHQFPNFFMLSNLIVIPLAFAILMTGFFYFFLHWIPYLSEGIAWIFDSLLTILNKGVAFVEQLPHSIYWGFSIEWYEVFLLYAMLLSGTIAFVKRKKRALIMSLSLAIVLMGLNVVEDYQLSHEKHLVIYNVKNELALDIFHGRTNTFYASEQLIKNEDQLLFFVKHNWFYRTGNEFPDKQHILAQKNEVIKVGKYQLLLLSDASGQIPSTDLVVINQVNFIPEYVVKHWKDRKTFVIIGSKVTFGVKKFLCQQLPYHQIYHLNTRGAFQFDFD